MALGDFFKSKKELEKEALRKRRKAFRDAENAISSVKDRVVKLRKDRDRSWTEAKKYLKEGQKPAAERCLQAVRATEVMVGKLEMKRWVFEQLLTKLELAKTDQDFTKALSAMDTVVEIDPETVADVLGEVQDKLGEQIDTEKIWQKVHDREMEGVESELDLEIPTVDAMMSQLQDEAAEDIGPARSVEGPRPSGEPELLRKIGEARSRLKRLMDEDR